MISYEEALRLLQTSVSPRPGRPRPLPGAVGSVTAEAAVARLFVPGFANAAMDGYALRAADTLLASPATPVELPVTGLIAAGDPPPASDARHSAWEILTGAPVPTGLDAVVPLERVTRGAAAGSSVVITAPLKPGQNVRQAGEDFTAGQIVVPAGIRLEPRHLMALAACGLDEVSVLPAPRVAVLITGNELSGSGSDLSPGRIRDANGPYLQSLLPLLGTELVLFDTAGDRVADLRARLEAAARTADVVITTGGVSAGRLDLLPGVVREIGGGILFHKVAIRPGKPILHARLPGGALLFGLPGNPLAVAVGMRFFVIPALRSLLGLAPEAATPALTLSPVRGRGTLRFFAKARAEVDGAGRREVRILPGQESFRIAPLLQANCWAIVPEGSDEIPAGGILQTLPLQPD